MPKQSNAKKSSQKKEKKNRTLTTHPDTEGTKTHAPLSTHKSPIDPFERVIQLIGEYEIDTPPIDPKGRYDD